MSVKFHSEIPNDCWENCKKKTLGRYFFAAPCNMYPVLDSLDIVDADVHKIFSGAKRFSLPPTRTVYTNIPPGLVWVIFMLRPTRHAIHRGICGHNAMQL